MPFESLSQWSAEETADIPKLSDIRINGKTIDGFDSEKRYYEFINNSKSVSLTATANRDLYYVKSEYDENDKIYKIFVYHKNKPELLFENYLSGESVYLFKLTEKLYYVLRYLCFFRR